MHCCRDDDALFCVEVDVRKGEDECSYGEEMARADQCFSTLCIGPEQQFAIVVGQGSST